MLFCLVMSYGSPVRPVTHGSRRPGYRKKSHLSSYSSTFSLNWPALAGCSLVHNTLFTKSGSGHAHTMHNLWRLGVVAMAEAITSYFRVENACTPNIKLMSPSLLLLAVLPSAFPPPFTTLFSLTTHSQHPPTLIIPVTSFPHQIVVLFLFVC